jgi:hypothetical protein
MVPKMVGVFYEEIVFIPLVNLKRKQALLESNLSAIRFTDWNGQKALIWEPSSFKFHSMNFMA